MFEFSTAKINYILWPMLLGMASFLISGVMASIVILLVDNCILATMIAGGIGGLLLAIFIRERQNILRMTISGIIGMPVGLIISFFLVEGFGSIFPSIGAYLENTTIPDISAIILMGVIFGAIVGAMVYGRKYICLFSVVCGRAA